MLPTPDTSHLSFDNIYEPAEDSYLLLDTLSSPTETAWLQHRFQSLERYPGDTRNSAAPIVVEVGVGSGVVLAFLVANAETIIGRNDILALGTDVNVLACKGATSTVATACRKSAGGSALFGDVPNMDLVSTLRHQSVDVLIFNPPYVPTEAVPTAPSSQPLNSQTSSDNVAQSQRPASSDQFERDSHLLSLSYAGGADGMQVTNRLLAQLPDVLHPTRGVAYVLLCAQNKPAEVMERVREVKGFAAEIVGSSGKKAGWEKLVILRIWRTTGVG